MAMEVGQVNLHVSIYALNDNLLLVRKLLHNPPLAHGQVRMTVSGLLTQSFQQVGVLRLKLRSHRGLKVLLKEIQVLGLLF